MLIPGRSRRRPALISIALLLAAAGQVCAQVSLGIGLDAATASYNRLLTNPPLPMLRLSPGTYKATLAPYLYDATIDDQKGQTKRQGDFGGFGGGATLSFGFSENWGAYVFVLGSRVTKGSIDVENAIDIDTVDKLDMTFASVSSGFCYRLIGGEGRRFSLPVFFGPMITRYRHRQRLRSIDKGLAYTPQKSPFLFADADMEGSGMIPGVLVGAQAGIPLGRHFQLNPFFVWLATPEVDADMRIVQLRVDKTTDQYHSFSSLRKLQRGETGTIGGAVGSIGVNLVIKPLGLSLNLTAPFLSPLSQNFSYDFKLTQFSISYSFGNYSR